MSDDSASTGTAETTATAETSGAHQVVDPVAPAAPVTDQPPPRPRRVWLRWTIGVIVTALAVVGMLVALSLQGSDGGSNDPRNFGSTGMAGMAAIVEDEGVNITISTSAQAPAIEPDSTVALTGPFLSRAQFTALLAQGPDRVVLIGYNQSKLAGLGFDLNKSFPAGTAEREPACEQPIAQAAGSIVVEGSLGYSPDELETRLTHACYPSQSGNGYDLLEYEVDGVTVDLVASGLQNGQIRTEGGEVRGNAALGMRLLGEHANLSWWVVADQPAAGNDAPPVVPSLIPSRFTLTLLASLPLLIIVCVWRGRRLGPILTERLPVVVPASETVEGHGRLYHRLKAYGTAAGHLRQGTLRRLARRFGVSDPDALVAIVSDRSSLPPATVADALTGPPPATEPELWQLKKTLARIEQEARP